MLSFGSLRTLCSALVRPHTSPLKLLPKLSPRRPSSTAKSRSLGKRQAQSRTPPTGTETAMRQGRGLGAPSPQGQGGGPSPSLSGSRPDPPAQLPMVTGVSPSARLAGWAVAVWAERGPAGHGGRGQAGARLLWLCTWQRALDSVTTGEARQVAASSTLSTRTQATWVTRQRHRAVITLVVSSPPGSLWALPSPVHVPPNPKAQARAHLCENVFKKNILRARWPSACFHFGVLGRVLAANFSPITKSKTTPRRREPVPGRARGKTLL